MQLLQSTNTTTQVPIALAGAPSDLYPCPPHTYFEVCNGQDPADPGAAPLEWWIVFNNIEFKQPTLNPGNTSGIRVGFNPGVVRLRFRCANIMPVLVTFSGASWQ